MGEMLPSCRGWDLVFSIHRVALQVESGEPDCCVNCPSEGPYYILDDAAKFKSRNSKSGFPI